MLHQITILTTLYYINYTNYFNHINYNLLYYTIYINNNATLLYYSILYYSIVYYTIYYIILDCPILYYVMLYYTMLYYTILYYTILAILNLRISDELRLNLNKVRMVSSIMRSRFIQKFELSEIFKKMFRRRSSIL